MSSERDCTMPPKVSILIPVYNRADLIIRSVEERPRADASEHRGHRQRQRQHRRHMAGRHSFGRRRPATRPFRNATNLGPTRNWIAGLEQCTGDYVKVLWSDDSIEPSFVAELLTPMLADPGIGLAFSAMLVHFADRDEPAHYFPERRLFTPPPPISPTPCSRAARRPRPAARWSAATWLGSNSRSARMPN